MVKSNISFNISERKILLRSFDIIVVLLILEGLSLAFNFDYFTIGRDNWSWVFILILYLSVFGTIFELYDLQKASHIDRIASGIVFTASLTVLFYLLTPFLTPTLPENRLQILFFYCSILLGLFLWRYFYAKFIVSPRFYNKVLVFGDDENFDTIIESFKEVDPNFKIIGFVNCNENSDPPKIKKLKTFKLNEVKELISTEKVSQIMVASLNPESISTDVYNTLMSLLQQGFPIKEYTHVYEGMTHRIPVQFVGKDFYKCFPFSRNNQNKLYLFFHRLFDIIVSLIGILFGALLLPLIMLGNLLGNRGPLFYYQDRVGKYGKMFKIVKYRTMIVNAEKEGAVWAKKGDTRITPFGKFLRRTRLDEFPQFMNILKGEMSLIGPRPERPAFVKELSEKIPFYEIRHVVKPGLTGWAQVKSKYAASIDDSLTKLQYDLFYIKRRGFLLDVNILIKTLSTVIFFRGQ